MMESVLEIYKEHGQSDYIGENITQQQHALQSAYLAEKMRPYDSEFILAALFHDVGHIIPSQLDSVNPEQMDGLGVVSHENRGANYLLKLGYTQRIAYLVASHVNAKRYLAGKDAAYLEQLSSASRATLNYQGGPMTASEMAEFESNQWFDDAILLRHIDDRAKIVGAPTKILDDYRHIISESFKK
jgi:putative nucleotidyltransferase with HDIG domain